jgi:hypothetical protein
VKASGNVNVIKILSKVTQIVKEELDFLWRYYQLAPFGEVKGRMT